jgi:hypothetical protein
MRIPANSQNPVYCLSSANISTYRFFDNRSILFFTRFSDFFLRGWKEGTRGKDKANPNIETRNNVQISNIPMTKIKTAIAIPHIFIVSYIERFLFGVGRRGCLFF